MAEEIEGKNHYLNTIFDTHIRSLTEYIKKLECGSSELDLFNEETNKRFIQFFSSLQALEQKGGKLYFVFPEPLKKFFPLGESKDYRKIIQLFEKFNPSLKISHSMFELIPSRDDNYRTFFLKSTLMYVLINSKFQSFKSIYFAHVVNEELNQILILEKEVINNQYLNSLMPYLKSTFNFKETTSRDEDVKFNYVKIKILEELYAFLGYGIIYNKKFFQCIDQFTFNALFVIFLYNNSYLKKGTIIPVDEFISFISKFYPIDYEYIKTKNNYTIPFLFAYPLLKLEERKKISFKDTSDFTGVRFDNINDNKPNVFSTITLMEDLE